MRRLRCPQARKPGASRDPSGEGILMSRQRFASFVSALPVPAGAVAPRRPPRLDVPEAARLFRPLGEPALLHVLLFLLGRGEAGAGEVAAALGQSPSVASNHLATLRRAGLVERRAEGRRRLYRVSSPRVVKVLRAAEG
jgi:DNA-binding transcriptional ArsR family regulator